MCSLTVVPLANDRVRIAFNRDEQTSRPRGRSPAVRQFGPRRALLPTDPVSGGTWLAVNDAAVAFALLNVNLPESRTTAKPTRSRGGLIPALLHCDSPAAALASFEDSLDYRDYAPFRLVLVGHGIVANVRWDGREPMVVSRLLGGSPHLFTSSGLGDALAEGPRRRLFEEIFKGPTVEWPDGQDAFHRSRWAGQEHLSVNMVRSDARTVSHGVLELDDEEANFMYYPDGFTTADPSAHVIPLTLTGVA